MRDRLNLFAICGTFLPIALPHGVKLTALGLDEGSSSSRLWLGLPLLVAGVLGLECVRWSVGVVRAEVRETANPQSGPRLLRIVTTLHVLVVCLLQLASILSFCLLLDGHVHLRACCWLYVVYAAGVLLVVA